MQLGLPRSFVLAAALLAWSPALAADSGEEGAADTEAKDAPAAKKVDQAKLSRVLDRLAGSSVLLEHATSIGHLGDLSPAASRVNSRSLIFSLAAAPADKLSLGVRLGLVQELTPADTTYEREVLVDDLQLDLSYSLPAPKDGPFSWSVGFGLDTPTSKASQAATLILALRPGLQLSLTAPVLDGLSFGYGITPIPRLHRYATASTRVSYPCSPAAGCSEGLTTDTGARNTAVQLAHDFSLGLSALNDKLSVSASLQLLSSRRYPKSFSSRWSEATLLNEGNGDGSPIELTTSFLLDVSFRIHESFGVSAGLWTPGGMSPGGGYYNPLANRHSQLYFDLVFYPVDAWIETRKKAGKHVASD